jgi:hypothetical protein
MRHADPPHGQPRAQTPPQGPLHTMQPSRLARCVILRTLTRHRRRSDGVWDTPRRPIAARNAIAATRLLAAAAPAAFHFSEPRFSEGDFDPQPKNGRRNAIERPKPALEQHVGEIRPPKDTGKRLLSSRFFGTHDIFSEIFRWRTRFADFDSEGSLRPGSPWPISAVHGSVVPAPAADGRRRHRRG